jgi:phosphate-selective porin OprO and OprP
VSDDQPQTTYQRQLTTRLVWLPVYTDATSSVLHIAFNYRYGKIRGDSIQVRSKPEVSKAPYYVDSKKFFANYSNNVSGEIYFRKGPLMLGSEFSAHIIHSNENGNTIFTGAYVFALYSFTGETRPYLSNFGIFSFQPVKKSVFKGGPGNIEGTISFSSIDLDDAAIMGGKFWRITPAIYWTLDRHYFTTMAYGFGVLNRNNQQGDTQFFQWRIGVFF